MASFGALLVALWVLRKELPERGLAPTWVWVAIGALVLLLVLRDGLRSALATSGVLNASHWPPYWIGIFVGAGMAMYVVGTTDVLTATVALDEASLKWAAFGGLGMVALPMGVVLGSYAARRRRLGRSGDAQGATTPKKLPAATPKSAPSLDSLTGKDLDTALDTWISSDVPVANAAQDFLGRRDLARLIASRLSPPTPYSQAVLGALGAGKSSLFNLVKNEADAHPSSRIRREFVHVDLWRYENPRAAVEGILGVLIECLEKEVNVMFLRGIPHAYAEAMTAAGGPLAVLPRLSASASDPIDVLYSMDAAATAIGIQYILWIEDLERFASGKPNARELSAEQSQRIAPVRALLYALDQLRSFSVIIATTELFQDFDLDKIARYVERIPDIDSLTCRRLCAHLRARWLVRSDIVDPAPRGERRRLGWPEVGSDEPEDDELLWRAFFGREVRRVSDAVAVLCRTPRTLKQALRRTNELATLLTGEIDVDDVLAMCAIREASPEAFRVIVDHYHDLRTPPARRAGAEGKEVPFAAFKRELAAVVIVDEQRSAIEVIVQEVFGTESARPQGLKQWNDRTDYMRRFLSPHTLREEDRDQPVLRVLATSDAAQIVALLVGPQAAIVEHFERLLSPEKVVSLLLPLVDKLLSTPVSEWEPSKRLPERPLPPGLIELWRMLREKGSRLNQTALAQTVEEAVNLALPRHLQLLHEIDHWFLTYARELPDLLPQDVREGIQGRLRAKLAVTFDGRADALVKQCDGAPEYLLVWLTWGLERIRDGKLQGVPFPEWETFAATLLEACALAPKVMLPQAASFVTVDAGESWNSKERRFDESRCVSLFGAVDALEPVFLTSTDTDASAAVRAVRAFYKGRGAALEGASASVEPLGPSAPTATAALRELVRAAGREEAVVTGKWFSQIDEALSPQGALSTFAVLPQEGLLEVDSPCVVLVSHRGTWVPLSETAEYGFVHALRENSEAYFVPDHNHAVIYRFAMAGGLTMQELIARFPEPVARRADVDRRTLLVELAEIHEAGRADNDPALEWLARNGGALRAYAGKHIAIGDRGVVDADASLSELLDRLGEDAGRLTLHYVPNDDEI